VAGNTVIAKSGTYNGSFFSKNQGVTIKAEKKLGAILKNATNGRLFNIDHSNLTIRGFLFDGQRKDYPLLSIRSSVSNITIEHNYFDNSAKAALAIGGTNLVSNVIVRHNIIEDTGFAGPGEGMYVGSATATPNTISGVQIYGNILRRFTQNGVDLKPNTVKADVHHNIFEGQYYRPIADKPNNEGTIVIRNKGHRIHDNIVRDIVQAGPAVFWVAASQDQQVYNNVVNRVENIYNAIGTREEGPGGLVSQVLNNIFCNLATYRVDARYGLKVFNNIGLPGGAPQSNCDLEISRILKETAGLPGRSYDGIAPSIESPGNLRITYGE